MLLNFSSFAPFDACEAFLAVKPSRRRQTVVRSTEDDRVDKPAFTLPIFPLRRSVKVPTERFTLNLYEERYIALAEHVLKENNGIFGALYCSHKAQIVPSGKGPIVPLVEEGDVGVVCRVYCDEDGVVPTREAGFDRRRIKLMALVVGRFEIQSVVHNGCLVDKDLSSEEQVPYIVARALRIEDDPVEVGSEAHGRLGEMEKAVMDMLRGRQDRSRSDEEPVRLLEESLTVESFAPPPAQRNDLSLGLEKAVFQLFSWGQDEPKPSRNHVASLRHTLFSFASVARISSALSPDEMLQLLRLTNVEKRVSATLQVLERDQGWVQRLAKQVSSR